MCGKHFREFGVGLGTGMGQRLVQKAEKPKTSADLCREVTEKALARLPAHVRERIRATLLVGISVPGPQGTLDVILLLDE